MAVVTRNVSSIVRVALISAYAAGVERITTAEAARRLGLSMSGVRRRIKAGQLAADLERRPQGTRLMVLWDAPVLAFPRAQVGVLDANMDANGTRTTHTNGDAPVDKDALIAWLQGQLEQSQQGQAELRRMLNLEQQTVASLRLQLAPARTPGTPTGTPTHAHTETAETPKRRGGLRTLLGWGRPS